MVTGAGGGMGRCHALELAEPRRAGGRERPRRSPLRRRERSGAGRDRSSSEIRAGRWRGGRQHRVGVDARGSRQPHRAGDGRVGSPRRGGRERRDPPRQAVRRDDDRGLRRRHRREPPRRDARAPPRVQGDEGGRRWPDRGGDLQLRDARSPRAGQLRGREVGAPRAHPDASRSRASAHGIKANVLAPGALGTRMHLAMVEAATFHADASTPAWCRTSRPRSS